MSASVAVSSVHVVRGINTRSDFGCAISRRPPQLFRVRTAAQSIAEGSRVYGQASIGYKCQILWTIKFFFHSRRVLVQAQGGDFSACVPTRSAQSHNRDFLLAMYAGVWT